MIDNCIATRLGASDDDFENLAADQQQPLPHGSCLGD
jgi:hypothetical protein